MAWLGLAWLASAWHSLPCLALACHACWCWCLVCSKLKFPVTPPIPLKATLIVHACFLPPYTMLWRPAGSLYMPLQWYLRISCYRYNCSDPTVPHAKGSYLMQATGCKPMRSVSVSILCVGGLGFVSNATLCFQPQGFFLRVFVALLTTCCFSHLLCGMQQEV